jgi:hypothetical protein
MRPEERRLLLPPTPKRSATEPPTPPKAVRPKTGGLAPLLRAPAAWAAVLAHTTSSAVNITFAQW